MDYSLSSEQQMFQKMFRDFAAKEVAKVADQADKQEGVPAKLLKRMAAQGFLGALLPEEPYGGAGLDFATFTLLLEALAAECASTALIVHVHNTLASRTHPGARQRCGKSKPAAGDGRGRAHRRVRAHRGGRGQRPDPAAHPRRAPGGCVRAERRQDVGQQRRHRRCLCRVRRHRPGRRRARTQRICRPRRNPRPDRRRAGEDAGPARGQHHPALPARLSRAGRPSPGRRRGRVQDRAGSARLWPRGHRRGLGRRGAADAGAGRQVRQRAAAVRRARSAPSRRSRPTWPTPRPRLPRPRG